MGLIATKLAPLRLPRGSVSRPALVARLRAAHDRALTLVSAPAGFGKTTLLTEWVTTDPSTAFAWVTLDGGDTEPVRLWTHLIAALARTEADVGRRSVEAMRAGPDRISEQTLPILFDELSVADAPLVVILDDYHRAETPEVNATVEVFLRYRPARVQLVVSTRSDPALGIPRLRATGDLVELRAESLRFDEAEISRFFEGIGVTDLSPSDEHRLAARTGGWPALLRLAALLMPDTGRAAFIESFTGESRQVLDYLTADVLDLLAADARDFMLRVSILDRLSGSLCDAVVGMSGSGAVLADLERSNLFISVDSAGQWYQQQQLFAEALRLELARTRPALVPVLHSRAAAWFEGAGDLETATEHAVAARDVPVSSRLVAAQVQSMLSSGRAATVRRWLSELSWPEAERDPELAFVRATVAGLEGRIDVAEQWLAVSMTGPPDQLDANGLPLGFRTDFLRAIVGVNDVRRAEAAALRAVTSAPTPRWQGVALAGLGQAMYLQGRRVEAVEKLRRAVEQIPDSNPILLAFAVGTLGLAESVDGSPRHADAMLDRAASALAAIGAGASPAAGLLRLAYGRRETARGDPRAGAEWYQQAVDLLGVETRSAWLANAHLLLAAAQRAVGDRDDATRSVEQADSILDRLPDPGGLRARAAALRAVLSGPPRPATGFGEELSEREVTVLRLAAAGLNRREIADQLFITYNTVKSHLSATYRKLGVTSRDAAVVRLAELDTTDQRPDDGG